MSPDTLRLLEDIVADNHEVALRPLAFFAARRGVLTLVFEGFSESILRLKRRIEESIPDLEPEHAGSQWPKVTLAAVRDDAVLGPTDVRALMLLSEKWNGRLSKHLDPVPIRSLSVIEFGCRSLERRRRAIRMALRRMAEARPTPPDEHLRYVRSVLSQFTVERLERYIPELTRAGYRESHYREEASGWTLVADVDSADLGFARGFLDDVEATLPGCYAYFAPESWHVTIRSLNRRVG